MVAIVSGNSLGLLTGSAAVLGQQGLYGNAVTGNRADGIYLNAATGNLVMQGRDEFLASTGLDADLLRTYNSQGEVNGVEAGNWSIGPVKSVSLNGLFNTDASIVRRIDSDGSVSTYTRSGDGTYVSTDGDGAFDTLVSTDGGASWAWTDGATNVVERYDGNHGGRLVSATDSNGNATLYRYDGAGLLAEVEDASHEITYLEHADGKLTGVRTELHVPGQAAQSMRRVQYTYDSQNRLERVITDLTPEIAADNYAGDDSNPNVYITRYTYDGLSSRVASATQSDGTSLSIHYTLNGGHWRVASLIDGEGRATTVNYASDNRTVVTDALGHQTEFAFDAAGQLTGVTSATGAGTSVSYEFVTDAQGNVVRMTSAAGVVTEREFDSRGNMVLETVGGPSVMRRSFVYDSHNRLVSEATYLKNEATPPEEDPEVPGDPGPDSMRPALGQEPRASADSGDGFGVVTSSPLEDPEFRSVRYWVRDAAGNVRFEVSGEGRVFEYQYDAAGNRSSSYQILDTLWIPGNGYRDVGQPLSMGEMESFTQNYAQEMRGLRTDYSYDFRGQLQRSVEFAVTSGSEAVGEFNGRETTTHYVYDAAGQLRQSVRDNADSTTANSYTYDGLGRLLASLDPQGYTSTIAYDAANQRIVTTAKDGLVTTASYDRAGWLLGEASRDPVSGRTARTSYSYDNAGRLRMIEQPDGKRAYSLYDNAGRKVADIDGEGDLTEYRYNGDGQVIRVIGYERTIDISALIDANGQPANVTVSALTGADGSSYGDRNTWNAYDIAGRLIKSADSLGYITAYRYDMASRLIETVQYANAGDVPAGDQIDTLLPPESDDDRHSYNYYGKDGELLGSIDRRGILTEYTYDAAGRLTDKSTYAEAVVPDPQKVYLNGNLPRPGPGEVAHESYVYDIQGRLVQQADAEGYLTEFAYDRNANMVASRRYALRPSAELVLASGQIIFHGIASAQDQLRSFSYSSRDQVVSETDIDGTVTTHAYDAVGRLLSSTRAVGTAEARAATVRYDAFGRVLAELSAEGAARLALGAADVQAIWDAYALSYTYDDAGLRTSMRDQMGNRWLYYYDDAARLIATISSDGDVESRGYNSFGQLAVVTNFVTHLAPTLTASLSGNEVRAAVADMLASIANPLRDRSTSYSYGKVGELSLMVDATGPHNMEYDAFRQEVSRWDNGDSAASRYTSFAYDRAGHLTRRSIQSSISPHTDDTYEYDFLGRQTLSREGAITVRIAYDLLGRPILVRGLLTPGVKSSYDAFGRILDRTDGNQLATHYVYSDAERSMTVTTPEGVVTTVVNNRFGQSQSIGTATETTTYQYDHDGNLTSVSDALGTTTANLYDRAGLLHTSIDGNGMRTDYSFDAAGRVLRRVEDPAGLHLETSYSYDGAGQVLTVTSPAGAVTRSTYDRNGNRTLLVQDAGGLNLTTVFGYDQSGMLISETNAVGAITSYAYDEMGRRVQQIVDVDGANLSTSFTYDTAGNVRTSIDANGATTRYYHDAENRLSSVVDAEGGVTRYRYDNANRLIETRRFAQRIEVGDIYGDNDPSFGDPIAALLTYDAAHDHVDSQVWDGDSRLRFTIDGSGAVTERRYDRDNRVVQTVSYSGRITTAADYTVQGVSAAVVAIANPLLDQSATLAYDARGRVVQSADGAHGRISYNYDGDDRVIKITRSTVYNGPEPTATIDAIEYMNYDAVGRMTGSARAMSLTPNEQPTWVVSQQTYDKAGNVTARTAYAALLVGSPEFPDDASYMHNWLDLVARDPAHDQQARFVFDGANRMVASALAQHIDGGGNLQYAVTANNFDGAGNLLVSRAYAAPLTSAALPSSAALIDWIDHAPADSDVDRISQMVYDGANRVRVWIDGVGAVRENRYDGLGNVLTRVSYAETVAVNSDPYSLAEIDGMMASIPRETMNFEYDALSRQTAAYNDIDAAIIERRHYDTFGQLVEIAKGDRQQLFVYDTDGRMRASSDATGKVSETFYDGIGRVIRSVDYAYGSISLAQIDVSERTGSAIVEMQGSRVTSYSYDAAGNVLTVTDPLQFVERYSYDGLGRMLAFTDKLSQRWSYQYDAAGRVIRENTPLVGVNDPNGNYAVTGRLTLSEYDSFGNLTALQEGGGGLQRTTRYEYDAAGHQVRTIFPVVAVYDPNQESYSIDSLDPLLTTTAEGATIIVAYDTLGRAISNTDAMGNVTRKVYDRRGSLAYDIDALGYITAYAYDAYQNVTRLTRLAAPYDGAEGYTAAALDAAAARLAGGADRAIDMLYNVRNQLIASAESAGARHDVFGDVGEHDVINFVAGRLTINLYDGYGDLVEQRISSGGIDVSTSGATPYEASRAAVTRWRYDGRGEKIAQMVLADTHWAAHTIDGDGDHPADAVGAYLTTMEHDAVGNQTGVTEYANLIDLGDNEWSLRWLGDGSTEVGQFFWSRAYAAVSGSANDRTTYSSFDLDNRKTRQVLAGARVDAVDASGATRGTMNVTTSYQHDALGRVTATIDQLGGVTTTVYDGLGRIDSVTTRAGFDAAVLSAQGLSANAVGASLIKFERDIFGNVVRSVAYANGADPANPINPLAPSSEDRITSTVYDLNGNAIAITDANNHTSYASYDKSGRVVRQWQSVTQLATSGNAPDSTHVVFKIFHYDAVGRLVETVTPGTSTVVQAASELRMTAFTQARIIRYVPGGDNGEDVPIYGGNPNSATFTYPFMAEAVEISVTMTFYMDNSPDPLTLTQIGGATSTKFSWPGNGTPYGRMNNVDNVSVSYRDAGGEWHLAQYADEAQLTILGGLTELAQGSNVTHQVNTYNAFGEAVARARDGVEYEYSLYDNAGNVWRTNAGDGVDKILFYNSGGNVTLMVRSDAAAGTPGDLKSYGSVQAFLNEPTYNFELTETSYNALGQVVLQRTAASESAGGVVLLRMAAARAAADAATVYGGGASSAADASLLNITTNSQTYWLPNLKSPGHWIGLNYSVVGFTMPGDAAGHDIRIVLNYTAAPVEPVPDMDIFPSPLGGPETWEQTFTPGQVKYDAGTGRYAATMSWSNMPPYDTIESMTVYVKDANGQWKLLTGAVDPVPDRALDTGSQAGGPFIVVDGTVNLVYRPAGTSQWQSNAAMQVSFSNKTLYDVGTMMPGDYEFRTVLTEVNSIYSTGTFTIAPGSGSKPILTITHETVSQIPVPPGDEPPADPPPTDPPPTDPPPTDPPPVDPPPGSGPDSPLPATRTVFQVNDRWGNAVEVSDPRNPNWSVRYSYNTYNEQTGSQQIRATVDGNGVKTETSPSATNVYYDALGRQIGAADAMGYLSRQLYDAQGKLAFEINAENELQISSYNLFGERISLTQAMAPNDLIVTNYAYDHLGNVIASWMDNIETYVIYDRTGGSGMNLASLGEITLAQHYRYDELGRRVSVTDAAGAETRTRFDLEGNVASTADADKVQMRYAYDNFGRKIYEIDGLGFYKEWQYDSVGRLMAYIDLGGARTAYSYDGMGRKTNETSWPRGSNGEIKNVSYTYDNAGLLKTIVDHTSGQTSTYSYDLIGNRATERVELAGRVLQNNSISYDDMGRMARVIDTADGVYYDVAFNYDLNGNRVDVASTYVEGSSTAVSAHVYNTYDRVNRQLLVNGILDENGNKVIGQYGHLLTYDHAGHRLSDTYHFNPLIASSVVYDQYVYDRAGRLTYTYRDHYSIDKRRYDMAGRLIQSGIDRGRYSVGQYESVLRQYGIPEQYQTYIYSAAGRVERQKARDIDNKPLNDIYYTFDSQFNLSGYDAAGHLTGYFVVPPHADRNNQYYYRVRYAHFDDYKQSAVDVEKGGVTSTTVSDFDQNGFLVKVTKLGANNQPTSTRTFLNDAFGHVLTASTGSDVTHSLVVNGELLGSTGGTGADSTPGIFANTFQPASESIAASAPFVYIVETSGETLQSVARRIWGDSNLWYLIADANGIGEGPLTAGTALQVPSRASAVRNDYQTYKPYDRSKLDGDLMPVLPPVSGSGGCSPILGAIVAVIVAAAVIYFTGDVNTAAGLFQAISSASATQLVAGAVAGNIAGQLVNLADGAQSEFSWKSVALSAVSAGISPVANLGSNLANAAANAAITNAVTQGVGILIHAQDHFDWRMVAAAAAGGAAGQQAAGLGTDLKLSAVQTAAFSSTAAGLASSIVSGGKINFQQIAVDAFGNALRSSLAQSMQPTTTAPQTASASLSMSFEDDHEARIAANPVASWMDKQSGAQQATEILAAQAAESGGADAVPATSSIKSMAQMQYASERGVVYTGSGYDYQTYASLSDGTPQITRHMHLGADDYLGMAQDGVSRFVTQMDDIASEAGSSTGARVFAAATYGVRKITGDTINAVIGLPRLATSDTMVPGMANALTHPLQTGRALINNFSNMPLQDQLVTGLEAALPFKAKIESLAGGAATRTLGFDAAAESAKFQGANSARNFSSYTGDELSGNFVGPLTQNSYANRVVGNVTAPIDFDGHILAAEIKANGNVVGGHSTASGNVQVIPGTASAPNAQGVYSARVQVADPMNPGQFLPKTNNGGVSTLFPDSWTANRIKVEVDAAYQNRTIVGNKWTGTTPSGVRVEGYVNPKTTVYPKF